jgi:hypothetical protein
MPLFAPVERDDRRGEPRYFVDMPSVLLESERISEYVAIINVARLGFLARTMLIYRTGERIAIDLPGVGKVPSRIIWCRKGLVGGQFVRAIDVRDLSRL